MTRLYYIIHDPMNIIRVSYYISLLNVIMFYFIKSTIVTVKFLFTRSYNQLLNYESNYFNIYTANSKKPYKFYKFYKFYKSFYGYLLLLFMVKSNMIC